MTPYFAYGSLTDPAQMDAVCGAVHPVTDRAWGGGGVTEEAGEGAWWAIGPARLPGYRLAFRGGLASLEPDADPASGVPGFLWDVSASDLHEIDRYEGVPHRLYRRVTVIVTAGDREDGKAVAAVAYIMPGPDRYRLFPPDAEQLGAIARGYSAQSIDPLEALFPALRRSGASIVRDHDSESWVVRA